MHRIYTLAALLQLFLWYDRSRELAKARVESVDHCKYAIVSSSLPSAVSVTMRSN